MLKTLSSLILTPPYMWTYISTLILIYRMDIPPSCEEERWALSSEVILSVGALGLHRHYHTLQTEVDWTFSVVIVPDLFLCRWPKFRARETHVLKAFNSVV